MKAHRLLVPFALAASLASFGCQTRAAGSGSLLASEGAVAAQVGSRKITLADVDAAIKPDLTRIELQLYQARKAKLDQMVQQALLEQKAKSLGIAAEELVKREIAAKVAQPSEDAVRAYFDRFKGQIHGAYEEVAPKIREALAAQATSARQNDYLAELRKEAKVDIRISPPRVEVTIPGGHEDGPKNAPITLVEFSDFQCPFCGRSQATVTQVLEKYRGKIHHVFMDFPLTSIHPMAMPAAVAGRCAEEQGKFWEYRKVLFERQRELSQENLKKWAGELTLDQAKFDACLDAKKYEATVQQSIDAGQKAGVSGTPGFFVNGVIVSGAQPFEVFQELIDAELERKS